MQTTWQLQKAKNQLSELVDAALAHGAQVITRHGKPVVKVVALTDAEVRGGEAQASLEAFLLRSPRGAALEAMPRRSAKKPFSFDA